MGAPARLPKESPEMLKHKTYFVYILQGPRNGRGFYVGKAEHASAVAAQRQTGIFQQNITACCQNEKQQASGYVWRYANGS